MIYIEEINKLTLDEVLIIVLFILFFFLLLLLVIKLYKKNKNLQKLLDIKNEELLIKKEENDIPINNKEEIITSKDNIIKVKIPETKYVLGNNKETEEKKQEIEEIESKIINKNEERKPYQKDVLKNIKAPTSPININNQSTIKELKMNLNDFIKKERKNGNNIKILTSYNYHKFNWFFCNLVEEDSRMRIIHFSPISFAVLCRL